MPQRQLIEKPLSNDIFEIMVYDPTYFMKFDPTMPFTKWAAIEVDKEAAIPESMESIILVGGQYAVFSYRGLPQDFGLFMREILTSWLPRSQYTLDSRPHFNILGERYKPNDPSSEEEVWIPIKKRG